jgi:hypothetical protein
MRRKRIMKICEVYMAFVPNTLNSRIVCSFYLRTAKNQIFYSLFHVKHLSSLSNSGTVVQHSVVI